MAHIYTEQENEEWRKTLHSKHIGAKTIVMNKKGGILLVKPNYRMHWHIPGGLVEPRESPVAAAVRELEEETAIRVASTDLCIFDILHRAETDDVNIVYISKILAGDGDITVQDSEIEAYEFVKPHEMTKYLSKGMSSWWSEAGLRELARHLNEES